VYLWGGAEEGELENFPFAIEEVGALKLAREVPWVEYSSEEGTTSVWVLA